MQESLKGILLRGFVSPLDFECADDSAAIQAAVDFGAKHSVKVVVPGYNPRTGNNVWSIERAIRLHTGSTVVLDGCTLRQADGMRENIFRNSNKGAELGYTREGRQYDISILGLGSATLDGGRHNGLCEANSLKDGNPHVTENSPINLLNVERVKISGLRIINQRYWGMTFHYCSHVRISDIDFCGMNASLNSDGIDLRCGCSDFIVENITGCTDDDTIALTCLKSIYDEHMPGFDSSIHNVVVRNVMSASPRGLVRVLNHNGKKVYNIVIENIFETIPSDPLDERFVKYTPISGPDGREYRVGAAVRIGENAYYKDDQHAVLGDTHNLTVRNVFGRMRMGVRLSCTLTDSLIDNIHVMGNGGTAVFFAEGEYRGITVSNIHYAENSLPDPTDDNRREMNWNFIPDAEALPDRRCAAVYFRGANVRDACFHGLNAGKGVTSVFGGSGCVHATATGITRQSEAVPVFDFDGEFVLR